MSGLGVSIAVEGPTDEAVLRRIAHECGIEIHAVYGIQGKQYLRTLLPGLNQAAQTSRVLILADLDDDQCAPGLVESWLPERAANLRLRIAVREVEAWLMADFERVAAFLDVPVSRVNRVPEQIADPKAALVDLARRSRDPQISADMVPRPTSGRDVGPAYVSRLLRFIADRRKGWRPFMARKRSRSLFRCIDELRELDAS